MGAFDLSYPTVSAFSIVVTNPFGCPNSAFATEAEGRS
jgi:hypothetical protein